MEHKSQLENKKYRNWVKAGLGIKYVKDGLESFCEHLVNRQHTDILSTVKRKHNLSAVSCGLCDTHTLQPDHVRTRSRQCPLRQINCNCQYPGGKYSCQNNVCGAIYDEIIQLHASNPPAPYWRNTDAHQWCTEPWAVAKCFINAPGYKQKTTAKEFDCPGLLHLLINNKEFQQHIKCGITGTDVFSGVRTSRNKIFHSHTMELEDTEVNSYIDDMIELLEDETEIKHRQESKDAVKNLRELKQEDFIISTSDEAEIRRVAMVAISEKEAELKRTIVEVGKDLKTSAAKGKRKLQVQGAVIKAELERKRRKITNELVKKYDKIRTTATKVKRMVEGKGVLIKTELEQKRRNIRKELMMKENDSKKELEKKGLEIEQRLTMHKDQAEKELEQKLKESKLQLETTKNLTEISKKDNVETAQQVENNRRKAEFQKKLVNLYTKYASRVPSFPLQPKRQQTDVSEMYVPPLMTIDIQDKHSKEWKEVPISMQEIFEDTEMHAKLIYVLGDAGAGKSIFCKILVHFWCIAHSYPECSLDESDLVKEMGRFEFLFYVLLRNCSDRGSVEEMLEKYYRDPALRDILQKESSKCLIVLDGLDEWNPERKHTSQFLSPGLPGRELDADFTIITTSRQWKFDALPITKSEVDKKIILRGIDQNGIRDLTEKTVERLNDIFHKCKSADDCKTEIRSKPVSDISHIPLILQQLIFLWFDDKLRDNSKYALYSSMLALFLEWKALKSSEHQDCDMITQECLLYPPLPEYLCQFNTFHENTRVIHYLSHLAYETLFDKNKETTLTFGRSTLKRLNIPNDVIKFCLNVGILTEEENVSLHASVSQQSSVSFFHKSIQEYLAAVYVASQFKEMVNSQKLLQNDKRELTGICKKFVLRYFGSCEMVVDILEQSNVFIMFCGLEPRLLTTISEYIYNVATVDRVVVEERNKLIDHSFLHSNKVFKGIQACILKCIDEVTSSKQNVHTPVYVADIVVLPLTQLVRYVKNIVFESVLSVHVYEGLFSTEESDKEALYNSFSKCEQLKAIKFECILSHCSDMFINAITKILVTNVSTLETISLSEIDKKVIPRLVSEIPKMRRLVSLRMTLKSSPVSHEVCLSLCKVLNKTTNLQHISLSIECEGHDEYVIDLSKHKQLQHVEISSFSFRMFSCNSDNLETCKLYVRTSAIMNQLCNSLYKACKLKHLELNYYPSWIVFAATTVYKADTENLIRLLPSLVSLSTLTLQSFTFTDNIITCPSDMKNLKEVELNIVTMSMTTWCKFIDSLPALPQSVQVKINFMCIGDLTIDGYRMRDKKQEADARQYVRGKAKCFRVTRDDNYFFEFTTRKA